MDYMETKDPREEPVKLARTEMTEIPDLVAVWCETTESATVTLTSTPSIVKLMRFPSALNELRQCGPDTLLLL